MNKNYNEILKNKNNELIYYIYDWDDNILMMPTKILMDKMVDGVWIHKKVSSSKFRDIKHHLTNWNNKIFGDDETKYKWRFRDDSHVKGVYRFGDSGKHGIHSFLLDIKKAISRKDFGPSWDNFIETLLSGRIFLICTARGHAPSSIRLGIEYIIFEYLSDEQKSLMMKNLNEWGNTNETNFKLLVDTYLNLCDYIGVDSEYFKTVIYKESDSRYVENSKQVAIKYFLDNLNKKYISLYKGAKVSVGYSDDTVENLYHIEKIMRDELSLIYTMDFYIIDTSNPNIKGGVKKKV